MGDCGVGGVALTAGAAGRGSGAGMGTLGAAGGGRGAATVITEAAGWKRGAAPVTPGAVGGAGCADELLFRRGFTQTGRGLVTGRVNMFLK